MGRSSRPFETGCFGGEKEQEQADSILFLCRVLHAVRGRRDDKSLLGASPAWSSYRSTWRTFEKVTSSQAPPRPIKSELGVFGGTVGPRHSFLSKFPGDSNMLPGLGASVDEAVRGKHKKNSTRSAFLCSWASCLGGKILQSLLQGSGALTTAASRIGKKI